MKDIQDKTNSSSPFRGLGSNKLGLFLISLLLSFQLQAQVSFNRGVNLTGWFQTSSAQQIQFTKYTKKDFQNIKSLGCDVIRLPINLFYMTNGSPDYTIDPLMYEFLDQAVNWAEELQMYLILDNHTTDDLASKNANLETVLKKVWVQMAEHYKNRSNYILYEILNEPNGTLTTAAWGKIQQAAITAIRTVDTKHTLVVGGASFNSYTELAALPVYADNNLIYTFHFYDPFVFTHQGASWPSPSMTSLTNVPFPYNASTMPSTPSALAGTWVASALTNYKNEGTLAKVKSLIDIAAAFKTSRNVKVYCGEFGVYIPNSPNADRNYWYQEVRKYLEAKQIPWTTWDYQGGFGLFTKGSAELFDYNLNIPLVTALGLTAPTQQTYTLRADSVGFPIYTDYVGEKMLESGNPSGGTINFYATDKPNNGKYCLAWSGSGQYGTVGFNFSPDKDLSKLKNQNYALSFMVRGNAPGAKFHLRFTDTKTSASDHPWRMNFTMDETTAKWDGKWHKVYLPLSRFTEGGSWDNAWFNPAGLFDWRAVDRFEIVAEQASLAGKTFWFDNIQLCNQDTAQVYETSTFTGVETIQAKKLKFNIFPNPVYNQATISYSITDNEPVNISLLNLSGQTMETIVDAHQTAGDYHIRWTKANSIRQGIYICRLAVSDKISQCKMIVM
ncbi:MAG: cellulase family glycosylhydrolase [Paludibacteraceae bacterium]|nr:cellulase family glycosylhydrolase [Paludibacteraceae bacterium]